MAKVLPNGSVAADKWSRNFGGSAKSFTDGIDKVQVSPMEKAAARVDAYKEGVMKAADSGKWAAGLRRRSLAEWKDLAKKDIGSKLSAGAQKGRAKWQRYYDDAKPYMESLLGTLPERGDLGTNIRRAEMVMRGMADFKRS